jgi:hypothetical protein
MTQPSERVECHPDGAINLHPLERSNTMSKTAPTPGMVPPDLVMAIATAIAPARLHGSPAQLDWAASVRDRLLGDARGAKKPLELLVLKSIDNAGWFLGNRDRGLDEVRWPDASQLAHPDPPRDERRC